MFDCQVHEGLPRLLARVLEVVAVILSLLSPHLQQADVVERHVDVGQHSIAHVETFLDVVINDLVSLFLDACHLLHKAEEEDLQAERLHQERSRVDNTEEKSDAIRTSVI